MVDKQEIEKLREAVKQYDDERFHDLLTKLSSNEGNKDRELLREFFLLLPYETIEDSLHYMWTMIHAVESFPESMYMHELVDLAPEARAFSRKFIDTLITRLVRTNDNKTFELFTSIVLRAREKSKKAVIEALQGRLDSEYEEPESKEKIRELLKAWHA